MEADEKVRLVAVVEGRVQGVGFRYFVYDQAEMLGLTGWVRNRWDGTVEVTAEGTREVLEKLLALMARGPRSAYVSHIKQNWQQATGEFKEFRIRSSY